MAPVRSVAWRLKVEGDEIAIQKLTGVGSAARKAIEPVPGVLRGVSAASEEFQSSLTGLGGRVGTVGRALTAMGPIGLGVAATLGTLALAAHEVFSRTRDADLFADDIDKLSNKLKMGAEAYQEIAAAAKEFDVDPGEVRSTLLVLKDNVAQFIAGIGGSGAGGIRQVFKALGLSREDMAQAGTVERQLNLIADALSKVQNVNVREGLAARLGLTAFLPMIENGAAGMQKLRDNAREAGQVMENHLVKVGADGNKEYEKLAKTIDVQMKSAMIGFTPIVNNWQRMWASIASSAASLVQSIQSIPNKTMGGLRDNLGIVLDELEKEEAKKKRYEDLGYSQNSNDYKSIVGYISVLTRRRDAIMEEVRNRILNSDKYRSESAAAIADVRGKAEQPKLPPTEDELRARARAAEEARRIADDAASAGAADVQREIEQAQQLYEKRVQFLNQLGIATERSAAERINAENAANVEMLRNKAGYYQALFKQSNDAAAAEIATIDAQVKAQLDALDKLRNDHKASGQPFTNYDAARRNIEQSGNDQRAAVEARRLQDQTAIAREARGAIAQLVEEINGPLELAAKQVGASGLQGMTDALAGIVTGSRDAGQAVGDMVTSILSDIARMTIQRSITAPLAGALDGWISGMFAGGHAEGGSLPRGMISRVNERGGFPEMFFNSQGDGTILSSPTSLDLVVNAVRRQVGSSSTVLAQPSQPPRVEIYNMGEPLQKEREEYDPATNTARIDLSREVLNGVRRDIRNGGLDSAMSDRFAARPTRLRRQ